jgi:hypothetical protein
MRCVNCNLHGVCRKLRAASRNHFRWSFHNLIAHPLSELMWLVGLKQLSHWVHAASVPKTWHIVWPTGRVLKVEELHPRPLDARLDGGDPFTPWHEKDEHYHNEDHPWPGSFHLRAVSSEVAVERSKILLVIVKGVR